MDERDSKEEIGMSASPLAGETMPNPNEDKFKDKDPIAEAESIVYLFGTLDRKDDLPSRHMQLAGRQQRYQDAYLRGRRDKNADMLKVDGGG